LNDATSTQLFLILGELLFKVRHAVSQQTGDGFVMRPVVRVGVRFEAYQVAPLLQRGGRIHNKTLDHRDLC